MKFIIDQCAGRKVAQWLTREGHDVTEVRTMVPDPGDPAILEMAQQEGRVLVTRDKGFGKTAAKGLMQHAGIVQLPNVPVERRIEMLRDILQNHRNELRDHAVLALDWSGRVRLQNVTEEEEPRGRFGREIAAARERRGLRQKELSARLGISAQYLNDIEHGRRRPLRARLVNRMARELDVDPDILWFRAGRIPPDILHQDPAPESIIPAMRALRETIRREGETEWQTTSEQSSRPGR